MLSETLPQLSQRAGHFSLIRAISSDSAPLHETGLQLIQTGRLVRRGQVPPTLGSVVASRANYVGDLAPFVILPSALKSNSVHADHGQSPGVLGSEWAGQCLDRVDEQDSSGTSLGSVVGLTPPWQSVRDFAQESAATRLRYGTSEFGRNCLTARRLVEKGVPFVTVNMFDSLAGRITWDSHAAGPECPTRMSDLRDSVCPQFDMGLSALLDDLSQRGLLKTTLVVAVGEFGRTPRINKHGGRDHWTGVWSALVAGCGLPGGQVLGSSDAWGSGPQDRHIHPAELVHMMAIALGINASDTIALSDGSTYPLLPSLG